MPTPITYYLNGPSLGSSTAVFTDAALSTCAPDGFYSDGVIVREQVSCALLPQQTCPTCAASCGTTAGASTPNSGAFVANFEVGAGTGAVVLKFNPFTIPDGIRVEFDSVVWNAFSSVVYGYLSGDPWLPVFLGRLSDDCITEGSPYVLDEYVWDGVAFVATGSTQTITVAAGQKALTANSPMNCVMVIPKTSASPSVVSVVVYGMCSDTLSSLSVACPAMLTSFNSTMPYVSFAALCAAGPPENIPYYFCPVTGDGAILGLYDWVFVDPYGETVATDGYYQAKPMTSGYDWFRVQDGVIVEFGNCP